MAIVLTGTNASSGTSSAVSEAVAGAAPTARTLIRELGRRTNGMVLAAATSNGSATTVIDTSLRKHFPIDGGADKWVPWVYAITGTAANIVAAQTEQRARQWTNASATILLYPPGFPSATALGDTFELHSKVRRSRLLEAINDGVRRLGLHWYRDFIDASITTTANTWKYTLPGSQKWSKIIKVEIQTTTDTALPTYPYEDARYYNYRTYRDVDSAGGEIWYIQFVTQPPIGRTLRVWAEGYFPELASDTDILAISGAWGGSALSWVYTWAKFFVEDEMAERTFFGETDKVRQKAIDQLNRSLDSLKREAPAHRPGQIAVPGVGTGQIDGEMFRNSSWLGLFRSAADHAPS